MSSNICHLIYPYQGFSIVPPVIAAENLPRKMHPLPPKKNYYLRVQTAMKETDGRKEYNENNYPKRGKRNDNETEHGIL